MSLILTTEGVVMTEFPGSFLIAHGAVRSAPESEDDVFCLRKAGNTFWYVLIFLISSMCLIFNDLRAGFDDDCPDNCFALVTAAINNPIGNEMCSVFKSNTIAPEWNINTKC